MHSDIYNYLFDLLIYVYFHCHDDHDIFFYKIHILCILDHLLMHNNKIFDLLFPRLMMHILHIVIRNFCFVKILKPYFEDKDEIYCTETDGNKMTIRNKTSKVKIKKYDSYIDILKADWLFPSYETGLICCDKIDPFIDLVSEFGYLHPIVRETFKYIYEIDSNFLKEYMSWAELNEAEQDANIFVNSLKLK